MSKILFVTEQITTGRIFQNMVNNKATTEIFAPSKVEDISEYSLLICDYDNNASMCTAEIMRLRSLCGFRNISLLVAVNENQSKDARRMKSVGADGIILKPFNGENTIQTIVSALNPVGVKTNIDMQIINPFIDATTDVMKKMIDCNIKRKDMFLKKNYAMFGDVSSVMGITGDSEGVIAITFHQDLAFSLIAKMAGCDEDDLSVEDVNDGVGEIINMITGSAKKKVSETNMSFDISLPTIIMGYGHQIAHQRNLPVIVIVFDVDGHPFALQVCISSNGDIDKSKAVEQKEKVESV